jgi:hypothetical protein
VSSFAMIHIHGVDISNFGGGVLEIRDHSLVWTETKDLSGKTNHSFSTTCGEIQQAELTFGGFRRSLGFEIRVPGGLYRLESNTGTAAAVILDHIRLLCGLGSPVLDSSRDLLTAGAGKADIAPDRTSEEPFSLDVFLEDGGGRGVLFISRTGVVYEQVAHQAPILKQGGKIGWKGAEKEDVARVSPRAFPCSSLTDITLRGNAPDKKGNVKLGVKMPEIDLHDGSVTYRFFPGGYVIPQVVERKIAGLCSPK